MKKLYILVDAQLPLGLAAAQATHAAIEFHRKHPAIAATWAESNNIVILAVPNRTALAELRARLNPIPHAAFHEPDLSNALTAICFAPEAARFLSSLPLLGKAPKGSQAPQEAAPEATAVPG